VAANLQVRADLEELEEIKEVDEDPESVREEVKREEGRQRNI